MKALAITYQDTHAGLKLRARWRQVLAQAQAFGAAIGLVGGVVAALSGSLLTAAGWFTTNAGARHVPSTMGAVLLFLTIPLIIVAARCLDWMEKDKSQRRSKVARYDDDDDDEERI